ncbi:tyrosine-type recombinase/integrase [Paucidesulfovibrio longus]|uniref:tyrosine-type recombinase/integrase n=1 Tax=Paucidesulfovibrio longus TaxID=889 RepID=UPI0003B75402|nr:tyrosine-type recombinase/integrase [Paucidesulfovibrio longus]
MTEKNHERKRFLSPEQVNQLLAAAPNMRSSHYLPLAILLAVEHGCNRQEALDLKWSDVILSEQENLITFQRTKNGVTRTHRILLRVRKTSIPPMFRSHSAD